ncbi:hypothetical protein BC833DRAFT_537233 [Globomyces pollinis-pini]|nr:hypothetical protein BC833DRAFT_537233 [Globomyces pollinis-pini]
MPITHPSIRQFELHLDNSRTLFLPSQKVEGYIALNLKKPLNVTLIRARFHGKVVTHLQKNDDVTQLNTEHSSITMFKDFTNLVGDGASYGLHNIPAGDRMPLNYLTLDVFPFEFRLPATNLPASFKGPFGSISYIVTAVVCIPNYQKQIIEMPITVPSTRDVLDPELQEPVSIEKNGYSGSFWWKSGHFDVIVSIPKKAFASEEIAPIALEIINHSNHGIILQSISLKQKVTYITVDRTRGPRTERIHQLNYAENFPPALREINRLIQFPIPPSSIMDPDIDTNILKVTHVVDFKIQSMARFSSVIKMQIPIVVAGFPFLLFEDSMLRRSVDTLPRYVPSTIVDSTVNNDEWVTNSSVPTEDRIEFDSASESYNHSQSSLSSASSTNMRSLPLITESMEDHEHENLPTLTSSLTVQSQQSVPIQDDIIKPHQPEIELQKPNIIDPICRSQTPTQFTFQVETLCNIAISQALEEIQSEQLEQLQFELAAKQQAQLESQFSRKKSSGLDPMERSVAMVVVDQIHVHHQHHHNTVFLN